MAGVQHGKDADECVELLWDVGYGDVTNAEGDPDWYYCLGKSSRGVGYHLHLARFMSDFWERHLLFRDFLRSHPDVARQYEELKKGLAEKYGSDRVS